MDYLRLSWQDIEEACRHMSRAIIDRGAEDHFLVGISRGGLVPLRIISDHLSAQSITTLGVRFYVDIGKTAQEPEVFLPVQGDVKDRDIILIDDISDTGRSLIAAKGHLKDKGARDLMVATVCKKPHTRFDPDIYYRETNHWVVFPWEVKETIKKIIASSESPEEAGAELKKAGFIECEYEGEIRSFYGGGSGN